MKWLAILNPAAHNGLGRHHLRCLARLLHGELGAECAWTTSPLHAREIARNSGDFDGLIAAGGDGTVYEVINGMDLDRQCLAVVPAGTGNGLARDLRVNGVSAVEQLRRPRLAPIDLVRVRFRAGGDWQERYVVHTSAVGYFAELNALGIGRLKSLGHLRYAAAACVQCCRQKPFAARLSIDDDGGQEVVLTNLAVNNTRYAGHFLLFPKADLQDGRLNLLYGNNRPGMQLLEDIGIVTQTYIPGRSHRVEARSVRVALARPMPLMLDGEQVPQVEAVRFDVVAGRLRCVAGCTSRLRLSDAHRGPTPSSGRPATARQPVPC